MEHGSLSRAAAPRLEFTVSTEGQVSPGTRLPDWETAVSASRQRRYLVSSEVDPNRYGDLADVSILGTDCFLALRKARIRIDRLVHLEQRLHLHGPVRIDEKLAVHGKIDAVDETPVGSKMRAVFEFLRGDGSVAVAAETLTLESDPGKASGNPGGGGDPRSGFRNLSQKLLTPTKVQAYTEELGNRIHFDPAYAVRFGLRAPLASGLMAVTWVVEALSDDGMPDSFDLSVKFVAPFYWDDGVDVMVEQRAGADAGSRRIRCVASTGTLACEAKIEAIGA